MSFVDVEFCTVLISIIVPLTTIVCIGGAAILLSRSKGSRSRKILSFTLLMWGLAYVFRTYGFMFGFLMSMPSDIISPTILISGNFFVIIQLLYPLEVLRPGWLTFKRAFLIFLPYILIVLFYYGILFILKEKPLSLFNIEDLTNHIGLFNVWFRFVLLICIYLYIFVQLLLVYKIEVRYKRWCEENYAAIEHMDVSWLKNYGIGLALIAAAYSYILLDGTSCSFVLHQLIVICFFCYVGYKGMSQENPYSEIFFRYNISEEEAEKSMLIKKAEGETLVDNYDNFCSKIPIYWQTMDTWIQDTKPYLRKDFKLSDAAEILPLNRSYISRVFNEGAGSSFCVYVRNCRMDYAKDLLISHPDMPINQIADASGFSSPSSFNRTFVQCEGLPPKQYRECKLS